MTSALSSLSRFFRYIFLRIRRFFRHHQVHLGAVAVVIGVLSAIAEITFRHSIDIVTDVLSLGRGTFYGLAWWHVLLMPVCGGLFIGLYGHFFLPQKKPQGVAEVITATAFDNSKLNLKTGFHAAIASAVSIGAGGSVGREGPVVHLGATIGSALARFFGLDKAHARTLLGCGIAAAISTAFNAPIAGVFFAMEVVVGHYALRSFTPIVMSSVVAAIITRLKYGDYPSFSLTENLRIESLLELPLFAALGLLTAGATLCLVHGIFFCKTKLQPLPAPTWLKPVLGGVFIGGIAVFYPQIMGVGYDSVQESLNSQMSLNLMAVLCLVKLAATILTLGTGFSGGIFSPALFIGAMLGGSSGAFLQTLLPYELSSPGTYAVMGMGGMTASVMGAPITAIMIIIEMTGDYAMTIALMVVAVVCSTTTRELGVKSYYHGKISHEGIRLQDRYSNALSRKRITHLVRRDVDVVGMDTSLDTVVGKIHNSPYRRIYVEDSEGTFVGHITARELTQITPPTGEVPVLKAEIAADLVFREPLVLEETDHLIIAVNIARSYSDPYIPVVNNHQDHKFVGIVHQYDVLHAFHDLMLKMETEQSGETDFLQYLKR